MSLWEQVKANMLEWYSVAAEKTEEMARIGVRRYDKYGLSREIERELAELGSHVYASLNAGRVEIAGDQVAQAAVARIRALEEQLAEKEREIAEIRADYQRRADRTRPRRDAEAGAGVAAGAAATGAQREDARPGEAEVGDATRASEELGAENGEPDGYVTAWRDGGPVWDGDAGEWLADEMADDLDDDETLQDDWRRSPDSAPESAADPGRRGERD